MVSLVSLVRHALRSRWPLLAVALLVVLQAGCVTRRFTIRSNPPGARVYVDDHDVGTTPVSFSYQYYGTRKIRLVKAGYETLTVMQRMPAPWYQYFPLDFFSENVVPWELRDERTMEFDLRASAVVPRQQLLRNGEELRHATRGSASVPLPTTPDPGVPPVEPLPAPGGTVQPSSSRQPRIQHVPWRSLPR